MPDRDTPPDSPERHTPTTSTAHTERELRIGQKVKLTAAPSKGVNPGRYSRMVDDRVHAGMIGTIHSADEMPGAWWVLRDYDLTVCGPFWASELIPIGAPPAVSVRTWFVMANQRPPEHPSTTAGPAATPDPSGRIDMEPEEGNR